MKEMCMLAGVGVGMVAGIMLYKYCNNAKKLVDKTEKVVMKEAEKIGQDVKQEIKDVKSKKKKAV